MHKTNEESSTSNASYSRVFCEDYKGYLVSFKEKGEPPLGALTLVSKDLLNHSQELIDSGMSYGQYQALVDASLFARAIIELNHPLALQLNEPLHTFTLALQSEKGKKLWGNRAAKE